ncbi:MAG: hypothetical protein IPM56_08920 [Ignavibacteriales bacterium]|nr:MAG: hypothetical protein IPM56_08920 [Ignavibacteriales bacterium]
MNLRVIYILIASVMILVSCNDKLTPPVTTGANPNLGGDTLYVQLNPAWEGFDQPQDVMVGREPFIYVADTENDRIVMMNLDGGILGTRSIKRPIALAQDYKLNLLVCAQFDTTVNGVTQNFSALYKIDLFSAGHNIETAPIKMLLPQASDLNKPDRMYTGVAVFYDNSFLVARTGPNNSNLVDPDNSILNFRPIGNTGRDSLIGRVPLLQPTSTGILSVNKVSSLTSFNRSNYDFVLTMTGDNSFKTQWLEYVRSTDFTGYQMKLGANESFLMTPGLFASPQGATIDNSGNIYVIETDSSRIYRFNSNGDLTIGFGDSTIFKQPYGVAHFDRILYVADTGNNRILRFILSTDLN